MLVEDGFLPYNLATARHTQKSNSKENMEMSKAIYILLVISLGLLVVGFQVRARITILKVRF